MSFNPAIPRTLIRTTQVNPTFAVLRGAAAGTVLRGTGPSASAFGPLSYSDITQGGAITGNVRIDAVPVIPADSYGWRISDVGGDAGATATWEANRDGLFWIKSTNEASIDGAGIVVDVVENAPSASVVARTGIHVKVHTGYDRGESSGVLVMQTGGGGTLTAYKSHRMRPSGKPNLSASFQGALEIASDDMAFGALFGTSIGFATAAGNPDPTLSGAISAAQTTVPLNELVRMALPGGPSPNPYGPATWPTPLYVTIEGEVISYTGKSAASGAGSLTGCVRGVNSTAAPHAAGVVARFLCANDAVRIRMDHPIAKGLLIMPVDGLTFDGRPAITIGVNNPGQPSSTSTRLVVRMNGAIETMGSITSTAGDIQGQNLYANANLNVSGVLASRQITGSGTPTIAAGPAAGTGPSVSVNGTDLCGHISLTTGTGPGAVAVLATVTFSTGRASAPRTVLLTPANTSAAALSGAGSVFVDLGAVTATSFQLRASTTPLASSTNYQWYWAVFS